MLAHGLGPGIELVRGLPAHSKTHEKSADLFRRCLAGEERLESGFEDGHGEFFRPGERLYGFVERLRVHVCAFTFFR